MVKIWLVDGNLADGKNGLVGWWSLADGENWLVGGNMVEEFARGWECELNRTQYWQKATEYGAFS